MAAHDVIIWASFVGVMIEASGPDRWGKIDIDIWVLNPAVFRYPRWDDLIGAIKENAAEISDILPKHENIQKPVWFILPGKEDVVESPQLDLFNQAA
ncbi:hypothetical protein [Methylomagnum ishizawai]|uniref:hypothetical protein n=1 Tax=Methylomagnum ishizawai TaxID=1760988 RepID=UPI000F73B0F0|nr:hypothetical protein [Methylomagnum ishizawai]